MITPGLLVTLEGLDNAGKTTVCAVIAERLRDVTVTKELTTTVGRTLKDAIRQGLPLTPEEKVLLFAADRLERQRVSVDPAIQEGRVVVADRWVHSALAYRLAEVSQGRTQLREYVLAVNRPCRKPDLAVYLDIPATTSYARQAGSDPLPRVDLERVRDEYLELVARGELRRVDGLRPVDAVATDVLSCIASVRRS